MKKWELKMNINAPVLSGKMDFSQSVSQAHLHKEVVHLSSGFHSLIPNIPSLKLAGFAATWFFPAWALRVAVCWAAH